MKRVVAFPLHYKTQSASENDVRHQSSGLTESAVIAGEFASRTSAVKLNTADTADLILRDVPVPSSDGIPFLNGDLHGVVGAKKESPR